MTMSGMEDDDLEEKYDFSESEPAPYAKLAGDVVVLKLDEDIKQAFPDSDAVNAALRIVMSKGLLPDLEALKKAS